MPIVSAHFRSLLSCCLEVVVDVVRDGVDDVGTLCAGDHRRSVRHWDGDMVTCPLQVVRDHVVDQDHLRRSATERVLSRRHRRGFYRATLRYTTIDESWLLTTNPRTVTPSSITAICCGFVVQFVSAVDKILTDIACRVVRLRSRASCWSKRRKTNNVP